MGTMVLNLASAIISGIITDGNMPRIAIAADRRGFVLEGTGAPFVPWGFNYDHDDRGRLIEDYWHEEWPAIEKHFKEMRELGANVVRVHLQLPRFMQDAERPSPRSLDQLARLIRLAERERLYLDLTGLGCYHKAAVPAWYDALGERERWQVQARFWEAIARTAANSPAIFCYDLMNEPVVPGGRRQPGDWLGPPFAGKHFVQFITLDQGGRPRPAIARAWIEHLVRAIRGVDRRHLVTVGLVDWSLDRPGLTSGFVPGEIAAPLDFISVHIYPVQGKTSEAVETLRGFSVGKPVVIEEIFPLRCTATELETFLDASRPHAAGWIGFYWGKPPAELRGSPRIADAITRQWLELFERRARAARAGGQ